MQMVFGYSNIKTQLAFRRGVKKIIVTLLTVGIILAESAIPVFAQDIWILDETEKAALKREHPFSSSYWEYAEAEAEVRYWVEQHKGEINSISDEVERYKAVAKEVCDFLTYDFKYGTPHIHFTLRDGKGVCSDYSTLTKGLCDSVGLQCVSVNGYSPNGPHSWNRVVLNGMTYDSDLSSSDLYGTPILMEGTPSSYREEDICEDLYSICCWTGSVVEEDSYDIVYLSAPEGTYPVWDYINKNWYFKEITEEDIAYAKELEEADEAFFKELEEARNSSTQ